MEFELQHISPALEEGHFPSTLQKFSLVSSRGREHMPPPPPRLGAEATWQGRGSPGRLSPQPGSGGAPAAEPSRAGAQTDTGRERGLHCCERPRLSHNPLFLQSRPLPCLAPAGYTHQSLVRSPPHQRVHFPLTSLRAKTKRGKEGKGLLGANGLQGAGSGISKQFSAILGCLT